MKIEKRTSEIFKQHPEVNTLYVTKDGQIFFSKSKAERNNKNKGFTEDPQEFFREGYTPENGEDLDEMESLLEETLQENKTLKDSNSNLENEKEDLKESNQTLQLEKASLLAENKELKNSLKALQDELNKVSETPKNAKK